MNPTKHPSSWNPPNHSHWRPDDWAFFRSGCNYEPGGTAHLVGCCVYDVWCVLCFMLQPTTRWLYFFSGCNFFQFPTDGHTTVPFFTAIIFSRCNFNPLKKIAGKTTEPFITTGKKNVQSSCHRMEYTCFAWAGGTFLPVVLLFQFFVLAGNRFWFYILLMYIECHTVLVLH
jgi:hypothetical protein